MDTLSFFPFGSILDALSSIDMIAQEYIPSIHLIESALAGNSSESFDDYPFQITQTKVLADVIIQSAGFKELQDLISGLALYGTSQEEYEQRTYENQTDNPYKNDYINDPVFSSDLGELAHIEAFELLTDYRSCIFRRVNGLGYLFTAETIETLNKHIEYFEYEYNEARAFFARVDKVRSIVYELNDILRYVRAIQEIIYIHFRQPL